MPHAPLGIFNVPFVAGDDVDVDMENALPGRRSDVDADVVAVRLVELVDDVPGVRKRLEQRSLLGFVGFEQGSEMAARDDDAVAERDGKAIAVDDGEFIFGEDAVGVEMAKGAGFGG